MPAILCGKCRVPVDGPSKPAPEDMLTCPKCGEKDTFAKVMEDIRAYAVDRIGSGVQQALKKATAGKKSLTYKPAPRQSRSYRFILDE
jgi:hypothetical protein